jgi:hypothetical protein
MSFAGNLKRVALFAAATLALAGCASKDTTPKYSGWLKDYSGLQEVTDARGNKLERWVSPELGQGKYDAILVEPVTFYPEPQSSPQVSAEALHKLADYMTQKIKEDFTAKGVKMAVAPAKGVIRLRIAITSVGVQVEGRSGYQYIPQAFIVSAAYRGVAGNPYQGALRVEIEVTDSLTGERLLVSVRSGVGGELGRARNEAAAPILTVDSVKAVVDSWADAGTDLVVNYIKSKRPAG